MSSSSGPARDPAHVVDSEPVVDSGPVVDAVPDAAPRSTRERILDIALELFNAKGYDKTSLREIAERLGFSKAAVYYHFASKDDILLALHERLHALLQDALAGMEQPNTAAGTWPALLDRLIDGMIQNRELFVLHERNRQAFEQLHLIRKHEGEHQDFEKGLRALMADDSIPLETRVRMACSLGAVTLGVMIMGEAFAGVPSATLAGIVRSIAGDVLKPCLPGTGASAA
ncbi:MAG: TetR/AcrR family transcriptional regulator [Acidimicrobiales bacterium]